MAHPDTPPHLAALEDQVQASGLHTHLLQLVELAGLWVSRSDPSPSTDITPFNAWKCIHDELAYGAREVNYWLQYTDE